MLPKELLFLNLQLQQESVKKASQCSVSASFQGNVNPARQLRKDMSLTCEL